MAHKLHFCPLVTIVVLVLSACTFPPENTNPPDQPILPDLPPIALTVSADTSVPFDAVGQVINYTYLVKNTGTASYPGPVSIIDNRAAITCPGVNTVGNFDDNLDVNEEITCTGTYTIAQADLDSGSVTNTTTATVSGSSSAPVTTAVTLTQNRVLTLTKAANPMTYNQVGQVITYTYVILNNGNITLQGPFSIADDRAAANCTQPDDNLLSPNEEMSCTASYSITQDNLNTTSVTNNATASNGTTTSNIATIMISTTGAVPPSSLVPGTDIEYQVKDGEWLWQIARCYGAHPKDVIDRNRPKLGNPAKLLAGMTLTVPNIGSTGTIYGPPCIRMHTVVSGDTWASIAQQYGADSNLIQKVNSIGLVPGNQVRVPVGPYNYP
jgi:hypothetical protein